MASRNFTDRAVQKSGTISECVGPVYAGMPVNASTKNRMVRITAEKAFLHRLS